MKKKLLLTLVVLCLATACGKVPKLAGGEEAVVSFKDTALSISATDLYNELKDKYSLSILVDLIDKKMLLLEYPNEESEAKKYAKDELDGIKEYYVDDNGKYDESALISALQQVYGINSIDQFSQMLELSYYRARAIEDYAKDQVTDKQINDYYKKEIVGDIKCSHILIGVSATENMTDEEKKNAEETALKQAKDVIKELNDGANWNELAKKYSTDKSNSDKGGDLGYFNKGDMLIEFEKAAYALKINEYSKEPVKTSYGYHIILKTGEEDKPKLDEVKDSIIDTLGRELQSSDTTLSIHALIELRKTYGVNIEDSSIASKYTTYINNQLLNAQNTEQ